jgi:hypothetical protein
MAKLNAAARKRIPTGSFAVIQHQNGKTVKKFPINDMTHAKVALGRVANRSPQLKAKVHAKIIQKFPALAARSEAIKAGPKASSVHGQGY